MRYFFLIIVIAGLFFTVSCEIPGVLMAPAVSEQKIPAEYDLRSDKEVRVAVLVEYPRSSGANKHTAELLAEGVELSLEKNVRISSENIVTFSEMGGDSGVGALDATDPFLRASRLGADFILYIVIQDYELYEAGYKGYYSGSMVSSAAVLDVRSRQKVWPERVMGKVSNVKIDIEPKGRDIALSRMISTSAHILTRNLYDCPRDRYKIRDEAVDYRMFEDI